ncbi:hypothetical protein IGS67_06675 [Flavimobilis sp. GY10621]|uniref:Uncharacterized protein n=1 Tax=Flavimobilis rhizosphaerae TaxID=2775421 RepID=A0ABR9DT67_9MICO|nr:hypothetical protein [Flavimobilis rhizosphaerae]MBD9699175.1 hypothetical protein [Flavimobilis rhizosphaerae]
MSVLGEEIAPVRRLAKVWPIQKAEQKIFAKGAADPQEQQADCMATAITGSTRYNYYTSSCKGSRAKNAKSMWKKWGLKYQNPERRWTTSAS